MSPQSGNSFFRPRMRCFCAKRSRARVSGPYGNATAPKPPDSAPPPAWVRHLIDELRSSSSGPDTRDNQLNVQLLSIEEDLAHCVAAITAQSYLLSQLYAGFHLEPDLNGIPPEYHHLLQNFVDPQPASDEASGGRTFGDSDGPIEVEVESDPTSSDSLTYESDAA